MVRYDTARQIDDAFRALSHPHRRYLLRRMEERTDDVVPVAELGSQLTAGFDDLSRERAESSLHHVHLPLLQRAGFVEYDDRHRTVRYQSPQFVATVVSSGLLDGESAAESVGTDPADDERDDSDDRIDA